MRISYLLDAQLGSAIYRIRERDAFVSDLLTEMGDARLLWTPKGTDTTTSLDETLNGRTLTYDSSIAARLAALGLGYYTTFDGSTNYATTPDQANFSFGNGSVDQPFSGFVVANVTDTANARTLISKMTSATNGEWLFRITTTDALQLVLTDASVPAQPATASNAAITQGSWQVFGFTYDGRGGATAANGITLYANGVAIASTATNVGTYVAMEDGTHAVEIGSQTVHTANFMQGSLALAGIGQVNLSASDHWSIYKRIKSYFGI